MSEREREPRRVRAAKERGDWSERKSIGAREREYWSERERIAVRERIGAREVPWSRLFVRVVEPVGAAAQLLVRLFVAARPGRMGRPSEAAAAGLVVASRPGRVGEPSEAAAAAGHVVG